MTEIKRTSTIDATPEEIFKYLAEPRNVLVIKPNTMDIQDIQGEGVGQRWKCSHKLMGLTVGGRCEVKDYQPNQHYAISTMGGIRSKWAYTLQPERTKTCLKLDISYSMPLLGKIGEKLVKGQKEKDADQSIHNIELRFAKKV
jgi:carbon monoxide dehydrogenase subunit G